MRLVKGLSVLLLLSLVALSCSKGSATEEIEYQKQMSFSGYTARSVTKAGASFTTIASLPANQKFGVFAYNTGSSTTFAPASIEDYTVFMSNVAVNYDGADAGSASSYTYSPKRYWPNVENSNHLAFWAYYPYGSATVSGFGAFTFTVASTPANQVDLMLSDVAAGQVYSSTNSGTAGLVNMKFSHMLTQVKFKGITDAPSGATVKITALQLKGIVNKGSLAPAVTATSSGWTPSTDDTDISDYTLALLDSPLPSTKVDPSAEAADLTAADQILLMIPQTMSAEAKLAITYTITTQVWDESSEALVNRTITQTQELDLNSATITEWVRNQQIVYTLNIGLHPIEFKASLADWAGSDQPIIVE